MAKVAPGRSDSWAVALVLADSEAHALPPTPGREERRQERSCPGCSLGLSRQVRGAWPARVSLCGDSLCAGCLPHLQMQINGGFAAGVRSLP